MLHFPLAIFAAFLGLIFGLQLVGLLILADLGMRMLTGPYCDAEPAIAEVDRVRVANHPRGLGPWHGIRAEPAVADDARWAASVVAVELARYGRTVLPRALLRRVVLCTNLTGEGRRHGGLTLAGQGVILLDVGRSGPWRGEWLRRALHHEISHALGEVFRGDAGRDDRWSRLNPAGFAYGGEDIVRALEVLGEDPGRKPDTPGFLDYYAMVGPGEDRAEILSAMMTRPRELRGAVEDDPILRAKCRLLRSELVGWEPAFAGVLGSW